MTFCLLRHSFVTIEFFLYNSIKAKHMIAKTQKYTKTIKLVTTSAKSGGSNAQRY